MDLSADKFFHSEVAVVLPAKDEELTIEESILRFNRVLPRAKIFVVDNNSSDKTNELSKAVFEENNISGCVLFEPQDGKAHAIKKGLSEAKAKYYVICDTDLTYPIKDVESLLHEIHDSEAEMAIGDRLSNGEYQKSNVRRFHFFGNKLITSTTNFLFQTHCRDLTSGFRVLSDKFVDSFEVTSSGFNIEAEFNIHAAINQFKVVDYPITYHDRPEGSVSKLNTYRDGFYYLRFIMFRFLKFNFSKLKLSFFH